MDLSQNNDAEVKEPKENRGHMIEWFYLYTTLEDENAARVTTVAKAPRDAGQLPMHAGTWGLA